MNKREGPRAWFACLERKVWATTCEGNKCKKKEDPGLAWGERKEKKAYRLRASSRPRIVEVECTKDEGA